MAESLLHARGLRPRVSVVIPAWNAASFIGGALASVFSQTWVDFETIVVDDGSSDTAALAAAIAPWRGRLTFLEQQNQGPAAARNRAIQAARGEFVALLDSDDEWLPGFLAAQLHFLDEHPEVELVYSDGVIVGDTPLAGTRLMELSPSSGAVTFERLVRERCTVLTTCTVARRATLVAAGLFDTRFRRAEDFHLWLRLALGGARLASHPQPLVRHRRRGGSLASDSRAMMCAFIDVLDDVARTYPLTRRQRRLVARRIAARSADIALLDARTSFIAGQSHHARRAVARALAVEPRVPRRLRLRMIQLALAAAPGLLRHTYQRLRPGAAVAAPPVV